MTKEKRLVSSLIVGGLAGAVSEYLIVKRQTGVPPTTQMTMDGLIRGAVASFIASFFMARR